MSRTLLGLKSVLVLAIELNALGTYSHIVRSGRLPIIWLHPLDRSLLSLNSVLVLCPCAEYIENLPTHSAQYHYVAESWTDKAAAVKMCD